jgi:hypothetical protein
MPQTLPTISPLASKQALLSSLVALETQLDPFTIHRLHNCLDRISRSQYLMK